MHYHVPISTGLDDTLDFEMTSFVVKIATLDYEKIISETMRN